MNTIVHSVQLRVHLTVNITSRKEEYEKTMEGGEKEQAVSSTSQKTKATDGKPPARQRGRYLPKSRRPVALLDKEELEKRRAENRRYAKASRQRRKTAVTFLEAQIETIKDEIALERITNQDLVLRIAQARQTQSRLQSILSPPIAASNYPFTNPLSASFTPFANGLAGLNSVRDVGGVSQPNLAAHGGPLTSSLFNSAGSYHPNAVSLFLHNQHLDPSAIAAATTTSHDPSPLTTFGSLLAAQGLGSTQSLVVPPPPERLQVAVHPTSLPPPRVNHDHSLSQTDDCDSQPTTRE